MDRKQDSGLKTVWRLFYPLLLYVGITMLVTFLASLIMVLIAMMDLPSLDLENMSDQISVLTDQVMEMYTGSWYYYILIASAAVTIPIEYLFYRSDKRRKLSEGANLSTTYKRAEPLQCLLVAMVAFGACIAGNNLIAASGLMEADATYQATSSLFYSASIPLQIVGVVIFVPACEELIFRGLIYNRMKDYFSVGVSMFLSAVLFGFEHGNSVQLIYACVLGYLLAYVYEKYHSFWAPVLFHAVANGLSVLITGTSFLNFMYVNRRMMIMTGIVGVMVVVAGVYLMRDVKPEPDDAAAAS